MVDVATLLAARELCTAAVPRLNDSRQPEAVGSIIVMLVLATLAVVLRLLSRKISAARFGIDDYLIVLALVSHDQSRSYETLAEHHGQVFHLWPRCGRFRGYTLRFWSPCHKT